MPKSWALLLIAMGSLAQAQDLDVDPRSAIDNARAEERGILNEINDLDQELAGVRAEVDTLQRRVVELENSRVRHLDDVTSANAILAQRKDGVTGRMSALYRLQRRGLARVVFGATDAADLRRRMHYLATMIDGDMTRLNEFNDNLRRRERAKQALEEDVLALENARTTLQLKASDLKDKRARRVSVLDEIRSKKDMALRVLAEQSRARKGFGNRIAQMASPEDTVSSTPFRSSYGKLPWPTSGRIVRRFGRYTDPYTGKPAKSLGIDIAAEFGTPFRAVADGVVNLAEFISGYGQTVAIDHGPYTTVYAHANGLMIRRGQPVKAGQQLGSVGNTGLTGGSAYILTFEIRYNGTAQDPLPWLSQR
jgi:septal ring factor EnvC (AmiA/AmiB activator)